MAKEYNATTRQLFEMGPADWLESLGRGVHDPARLRVIDSNLATIVPQGRPGHLGRPARALDRTHRAPAARDLRLPDRSHL
jgi:hypothetical protein